MVAIFIGFTAPITAPQILWVNMVTSVALGLVISFEPHELDVMQRLPRAVDRPILDGFGLWRVIFVGLALLSLTLWAFFWMKSQDASDELARAVAVNALVIGQVFYLLNSRFKVDSSLSLRAHLGNKYLPAGIGIRIAPTRIARNMCRITQVRDNIYLINVITRAQDEQRVSLSTLRALQLPLPNGRTVPLSQVATFDFEQEFPLIWRRQRVPTLTVQADVASGATPEAAVRSLAPAVEKLNESLPKGYRIDAGGTVEESAQSQASVFAKVPLMLFLMLLFLMAQLHSFSRLVLVLSIVPMGLIGIVAALLFSGRPLGFVAILGILALMGMIARNAVILIEQIETERAEGRETWDAVVQGTLSRFRPIMLTAISTVLGFIPIAPTVFWGPMAFAIMGGLFVATMLTLIVLPALYVAWFRVKEPARESAAA
jgi:hypothetical protein